MPRILTVALALTGAVALAQPQQPAMTKPDELPTLLVINIEPQGVEKEQASALTDAVVQALSQRGLFKVISTRDVQTLISAERQRQLLSGCDTGDCARDIGTAVNAKYVLNGSLSKVGMAYQLALQTLDTEKNQSIGRSIRIANDLGTLAALVPYAASEATGTPLPPPKPRWVQYSMIAAGSALIIGGAGTGMFAIARAGTINDELAAGRNLQARSFYEQQGQGLLTQRYVSLALLAAGAGLVGAGLYLMPPPEGGPRMAFVFSPGGVGVAGVFP